MHFQTAYTTAFDGPVVDHWFYQNKFWIVTVHTHGNFIVIALLGDNATDTVTWYLT